MITVAAVASTLWAGVMPAMAGDGEERMHAPMAYIISPKDGDTVKSPVRVQFGLLGMGVAPAGIDKPNTGHHHLLVDADAAPAAGAPIPNDDNHRHFGGGQTETLLNLEPGSHTLQLMLGNKDHIPVEGVKSQTITVMVE
jgi:hypothetical protein